MIRSFYIDNFKSMVDFRLPPTHHQLGSFTCLVGLNGAGKSTVLQAFDFVGHLANGQVVTWLKQREWKTADLTSRFLKKKLIQFELDIEVPGEGRIVWSGSFNTTEMRCTAETVTVDGVGQALHIKEGQLLVSGTDSKPSVQYPIRSMKYEGSTLSFIDVRDVHPALGVLKRVAANLRSLDLLSPQSMRRRAKEGADIGYGGERLGAFIHGLPAKDKAALTEALKKFYPKVSELSTTALRAGWKDLRVVEQYGSAPRSRLESDARQVSDGLLRVLAVLSQVSVSDGAGHGAQPNGLGQSCVLFDEIENSINPELMQKLVELLLGAQRQVIVTTHNPLVLNYLPDEVAKEAVWLVYRNNAGHTKVVRLFDLPGTQKKLALLGPGEVFVDTNLEALLAEAMLLDLIAPAS
ncbi:AAA family ATPase [Verminephrobacter eiseniae]|uniref:AAA family ATPase n=1 Tax=Verminephrobacter eiseniae TaxID=364317 RepID=UPI00223814BE|nr:ATP-binding protein [Verminephrobacter eiseniae]MCW5238066.1 ATP-binding protein [Verminephrobacter eiseniae]